MDEKEENYSGLKGLSLREGAYLFGVADLKEIKVFCPAPPYPLPRGLDYAISIGVRLSNGILEDIDRAPTKLYFYHYRQLNQLLDSIALKVTGAIQKKGYEAFPIPSSQIIDWERNLGHLNHKIIANFAGLGFIGKNNLLVNPLFGSRIRLVTILTDIPLKTDKRSEEGCKECERCVEYCPASAIKETQENFDANGCFAKLKEFKNRGLVGQYVCGVCVKACKGGVR